MSKVLITHSYFLRFDPKQWKMQQPYPPLGALYAASVLRTSGFEVSLFDPMFSSSPDEIIAAIKKFSPRYVVLYDDGFNYLTKMCLTNMREAAFRMIQLSKQFNCKVIISSSDAADHFEKYLQHGADFIVIGEGERTLSELLASLERNDSQETIHGLAFTKDSKTMHTPKREVLRNLDALPLPAWDLVDMAEYKKKWMKSSGYFSLNISTTRGCPFHCNWCAKPIYGNRYNVHSVEHVVEEIKLLKEKYNVQHFWMTDDIFGLKPGWTNAFANELDKENLKIRFKIQSRVDLLLQEENIAALARAGCETVWVGAESGSQKILDAMEKGTTIAQIHEATRLLKKHSIRVAFFLQFGYPGEMMEDIQETIGMVMKLMPDDIGVSVSYPLPGTKFHDQVKDDLKLKANWTDSDDLALMFQNTYPAQFYRDLQRYLHKRFRMKQDFALMKSLIANPARVSGKSMTQLSKVPFHVAGSWMHRSRLKRYDLNF